MWGFKNFITEQSSAVSTHHQDNNMEMIVLYLFKLLAFNSSKKKLLAFKDQLFLITNTPMAWTALIHIMNREKYNKKIVCLSQFRPFNSQRKLLTKYHYDMIVNFRLTCGSTLTLVFFSFFLFQFEVSNFLCVLKGSYKRIPLCFCFLVNSVSLYFVFN